MKNALLAARFSPRTWLILIAEELPDWASPLAAWLVNREVARLERALEANRRRAAELRWQIEDACRLYNEGLRDGRALREMHRRRVEAE